MDRLDAERPGWDRDSRVVGALAALESGMKRETVVAVYGEQIVQEAEGTMDDEVQRGIWRHFKGREYLVEGEFPNTETGEVHIAYRPLYAPYKKCSRTKTNFLEPVDRPEHDYKGPRFVLVHAF